MYIFLSTDVDEVTVFLKQIYGSGGSVVVISKNTKLYVPDVVVRLPNVYHSVSVETACRCLCYFQSDAASNASNFSKLQLNINLSG